MYVATFRRPGGWAQIADPDMPTGRTEMDTVRCGHCGGIIFRSKLDGSCYQCQSPICTDCVMKEVCLPFEAWLDATEGTPLRGRWAQSFAEWMRARTA